MLVLDAPALRCPALIEALRSLPSMCLPSMCARPAASNWVRSLAWLREGKVAASVTVVCILTAPASPAVHQGCTTCLKVSFEQSIRAWRNACNLDRQ